MDISYKETKGFTLIEIAIVIVIIGIIIAGFFAAANIYLKKEKITEIDTRMKEVRLALTNYIADEPPKVDADGNPLPDDEARFPCPAPLTTKKGDANHAEELCPSGPIAIGDNLGGVFVIEGDQAGSLVLVGAVPTKTLEIPESLMLDAYGNRMTYAVTYALTTDDALLQPSIAKGQIGIRSDNTDPAAGVTGSDGFITHDANFFIVSHGADGAGSYTANGVLNPNTCRTTSTLGDGDSQNCTWQTNQKAVFIDNATYGFSTASDSDGFYDDVALFQLGEDKGWWEATDSSGTDIRNRSLGNVLVTTKLGVRNTLPQAALDVGGDIKVGNSGDGCTDSNRGSMRYNAVEDTMEFCSQLGWTRYSAPKCRIVEGPTKRDGSVARCNSNEYLMNGGGECSSGQANSLCGDPLGFVHVSRPGNNNTWHFDCWSKPPMPSRSDITFTDGDGNSVTVPAYKHGDVQDVCGKAYAVCCEKYE